MSSSTARALAIIESPGRDTVHCWSSVRSRVDWGGGRGGGGGGSYLALLLLSQYFIKGKNSSKTIKQHIPVKSSTIIVYEAS